VYKRQTGEVYLIKGKRNKDSDQLPLTNISNNIFFGEDFTSLIRIPNYSADEEYTLNVYRMNIDRSDTTNGENVYSYTVRDED